jgi:hypothetical protein
MGHRVAMLGLCVVMALMNVAAVAQASSPRLQLFSNGEPVPSEHESTVLNETAFPGFTCEGFDGSMYFRGGPASSLAFKRGEEGLNYAFDVCKTRSGEEVSTESRDEGGQSKLREVTVSSTTVTESFEPVYFEDDQSSCVWVLRELEGPLPRSGSLEHIHVSGALKLDGRLSAHSCPKTGKARGIATIEEGPEQPAGSYRVESVGQGSHHTASAQPRVVLRSA